QKACASPENTTSYRDTRPESDLFNNAGEYYYGLFKVKNPPDENFVLCRVSGMEAPAAVEWSTAGKWRRRPAQPAAVLTGSASSNPFP
ncbi:hypothetical protein ACYA9A_29000, partial [Klebsiella pneumoniae]|nr:hypothetical protein [Klebsiella variicola]MCM6022071.1 hypothetical protein [Klebsiella pneumoniae]HBY7709426.1 hypothetical protein [Klebsiella pneumoniae]